jgi:hypothetical protein
MSIEGNSIIGARSFSEAAELALADPDAVFVADAADFADAYPASLR